jgi:lipopolysaccharide heptosyltransferase II
MEASQQEPRVGERTSPRTVLVVQLWGIGDVILTTPALRAMRERWPGATITFVAGSAAAAEALRGSPLIDRLLVAPRRQGIRFLLWALRLRRHRFDLAFVATRQNPQLPWILRVLAGAKAVAADAPTTPSRFARYSRRVHIQDAEHRSVSDLALLESIVGPTPVHPPAFHIEPEDVRAAARVLDGLGLSPRSILLGVNPGSDRAVPQKRYPDPQMRAALREVLDRTAELHALVFFGGESSDARDSYRDVHPRLHVVTDLPIRTIAALSDRCALFLGGDTGLVHIAAARGCPCVVIAGPTRIESTRPWGESHEILRTAAALPCMPCYAGPLYGVCDHISCMRTLDSHDVASRVSAALERVRGPGLAEIAAQC